MKKDFVCQEDFSHPIWGAVSVIMEGVYRIGQFSGCAMRSLQKQKIQELKDVFVPEVLAFLFFSYLFCDFVKASVFDYHLRFTTGLKLFQGIFF
jgi:hypothetical protein